MLFFIVMLFFIAGTLDFCGVPGFGINPQFYFDFITKSEMWVTILFSIAILFFIARTIDFCGVSGSLTDPPFYFPAITFSASGL